MDPKPTVGISPYSAFNNNPILLSDVLGDSIPKDNNNYLLPYNPVFNAPNFSTGLTNALTNVGNFVSNVSVGMLSEGAKGVQSYFAGGYKEPSTSDPIQGVLDFTHSQGEYLFHTPINQQLTDLGHAATDLHNYELPAQIAIGGFVSFSKISVTGNFSLTSSAAVDGGVQYTKSSLSLGREMHAAYKLAEHSPELGRFKEFTGIKGIRPDFVDFGTKTIFELKPFNPRGVQLGTEQLGKYKSIFEENYGGTWKTVLEHY